MKPLFLLAFIILSFTATAQDSIPKIPYVNDKIIYQDTVSVKGLTKQQLYKNAKQWVIDFFRDFKTTIETEDPGFDHLSLKAIYYIKTSSIGIGRSFKDRLMIQLDFKDGKYRYKIYDFHIKETVSFIKQQDLNEVYAKLLGKGSIGFSKGQCRDLLLSNDDQVHQLISSLKKSLSVNDDF